MSSGSKRQRPGPRQVSSKETTPGPRFLHDSSAPNCIHVRCPCPHDRDARQTRVSSHRASAVSGPAARPTPPGRVATDQATVKTLISILGGRAADTGEGQCGSACQGPPRWASFKNGPPLPIHQGERPQQRATTPWTPLSTGRTAARQRRDFARHADRLPTARSNASKLTGSSIANCVRSLPTPSSAVYHLAIALLSISR